jgi:hypothetical protein
MKSISFLNAPIVIALGVVAQNAQLTAVPADSSPQYQVVERGPNHAVWQRVEVETNEVGEVLTTTNSYVELQTGKHYLENGQWQESSTEIQITPEGATAQRGPHKVTFLSNINAAGAIDLLTPDGKHLRSHILGIAYLDSATGQSVLIAELKDSTGAVLPSKDKVIYADAFTDFRADVIYTYSKAGLEQDIVLRQQPPSPAEFGLNPATTHLQVLTEFLDTPEPAKEQRVDPATGMIDQRLDFGKIKMPKGKAFAIGQETKPVSVVKQWTQLDGRTFLIEEVKFSNIEAELQKLPPPGTAKLTPPKDSILHRVASHRLLPARKIAKASKARMEIASMSPRDTGYVLDYVAVTSDTNFTFKGDTTYYVSGTFNLSGTNTIEGGAVIKYTNHPTAKISIGSSDQLACKTDRYRPAILTSKDDNSVGEAITGSTGNPTNYNGGTYLSGGSSPTYKYLRFAYAGTGIFGLPDNGVSHCQFVSCGVGIQSADADIVLHNVLFSGCGTAVGSTYGGNQVRGEHITADQLNTFFSGSPSAGSVTNSLFTAVTSLGVTLYNSATNSSGSGIYQSIGAGNYYLANGSPYRNYGTTSIDTNTLAALRKKTTYPPLLLTNTVSWNTTLAPQAQRDTDALDLGYHYDPLDYVTDIFTVTNATLTLTNGVAVASYNNTGIWIQDNAAIVSVGSPLAPNYFVRYQSAQEQAVALDGSSPSSAIAVNPFHYGSVGPNGTFRFSKFLGPANSGYHLYHIQGTWNYNNLIVQDCEFWNGQNSFRGPSNPTANSVGVKNSLFNRSSITSLGALSSNGALSFSNNLVYGTSVMLRQPTGAVWQGHDNAFDVCTISTSSLLTNSHNAYINCTAQFSGSLGGDVVLTNFTYATGPLGDYYQVSTNLVDAGSQTAPSSGLFHYTTATDQTKETTTQADIGFHYVALDANGQPNDGDSDGVPDYIEDANGNGSLDSGETKPDSASDRGFKVQITRPRNNSILP